MATGQNISGFINMDLFKCYHSLRVILGVLTCTYVQASVWHRGCETYLLCQYGSVVLSPPCCLEGSWGIWTTDPLGLRSDPQPFGCHPSQMFISWPDVCLICWNTSLCCAQTKQATEVTTTHSRIVIGCMKSEQILVFRTCVVLFVQNNIIIISLLS